jgi:hypothetical protein
LGIGEYYEIKEDWFAPLKITLKEISRQSLPSPYESISEPDSCGVVTDAAIIEVRPGFTVYPGRCVKRLYDHDLIDDAFVMRSHHQSIEGEGDSSIFYFLTENDIDGEAFFRCFVHHINTSKQEVELDIYFTHLEADVTDNNPI